jgi:hypothetical protein
MTDRKPTTIRLSDGTSFDVSGPHRIVRKNDGLYVVGHGGLTPVDTYEEALALIRDLNDIDKKWKILSAARPIGHA